MLRTLAGPDHHDLSSVAKQIQENFEWVSETDASVDLQQAMNLFDKDKKLTRL
jgi:hypothetical protein